MLEVLTLQGYWKFPQVVLECCVTLKLQHIQLVQIQTTSPYGTDRATSTLEPTLSLAELTTSKARLDPRTHLRYYDQSNSSEP